MAQFTYDDIFKTKQHILFVMAHPDDVIVFYGALIHKLIQDKKDIYVVTVTNGARGSQDKHISEAVLSKQRIDEEIAALQFLGVPQANFTCLGYKDGVESNYKLIGEIAKYIRKHKADVVCTHEPTGIYLPTYDNTGFFVQHRDHRKVAEAVMDSAYPFSRDRSFFPEHAQEGIEPHTVKDLVMSDDIACNFDIDYTDDLETKRSALLCHKSQMTKELVTEILDTVKFDNRYMERYFYIKLLW